MKKVTIDEVMSWHPCSGYTRELVEELFGERTNLSALDILSLDISISDRLWAVLRNEFFSYKELRLMACDFAESVVHLCDDQRPAEAIRVSRLFAVGEATDEELDAARSAARSAAWSAARSAARSAAWSAACADARSAARSAARYAACAVPHCQWVGTAAWASARAVEKQKQIRTIKRYLEAQ